MAEIQVEQKEGGQLTWLWALLALAAVAGLMIWLASVAEPTNMVSEESAEETVERVRGETEFATVAPDPTAFIDSTVVVTDARVIETLSPRVVVLEAEGMQEPWMVVAGSTVGEGALPALGERYTVTGRLAAPEEGAVQRLVDAGIVDEFASTAVQGEPFYLLAEEVQPAGAAAAAPADADTAALQ